MDKAEAKGVKFLLPEDVVVADKASSLQQRRNFVIFFFFFFFPFHVVSPSELHPRQLGTNYELDLVWEKMFDTSTSRTRGLNQAFTAKRFDIRAALSYRRARVPPL